MLKDFKISKLQREIIDISKVVRLKDFTKFIKFKTCKVAKSKLQNVSELQRLKNCKLAKLNKRDIYHYKTIRLG